MCLSLLHLGTGVGEGGIGQPIRYLKMTPTMPPQVVLLGEPLGVTATSQSLGTYSSLSVSGVDNHGYAIRQ